MTDNNEFRVRYTRRSQLDPRDWLLTPEGKPLRARYMPRTAEDDPQVLQLLGYRPPRPTAPVIRVDRGLMIRGNRVGESLVGKVLAAGTSSEETDYPTYWEVGTCTPYSTEDRSAAEIDEWTELRIVDSDQVTRWIRTEEAYNASLDERLGIDSGDSDDQTEDDLGAWPTIDYPRIIVIDGVLDDDEVQFVTADRAVGPDGTIRWAAHNLAGDVVGEFWQAFDKINDWERFVPVASPYWPTAEQIMILAGRIGVNEIKTAQVAERVDWKPGDPEPGTYPRYRITHGTHRGAVIWERGSFIGSYAVIKEGSKPTTPPAEPDWPTEDRIYVRHGRLDGFDVHDLIGTRIDHADNDSNPSYPRYEVYDLDGDYVGEFWNNQPVGVDRIYDWSPCPIRDDVTEWPTAKRIQILAGTVDNYRITKPVIAERVDWREGALSTRECFPKYRIVQGTAPEGALDVLYRSFDSDRITRYAVLEEDSDD